MSTKTSLMIFGIVAMSMALIAAASLTNLAIAAKTDNNDNGKSKHDNGSGSSGSGSSGSGAAVVAAAVVAAAVVAAAVVGAAVVAAAVVAAAVVAPHQMITS